MRKIWREGGPWREKLKKKMVMHFMWVVIRKQGDEPMKSVEMHIRGGQKIGNRAKNSLGKQRKRGMNAIVKIKMIKEMYNRERER